MSSPSANLLHWADYVVFVTFLLVSISIGVYFALSGGRQRTTGEFLVADRQLHVLPTMLSLLVSYQSAIAILGAPAEMFTKGSMQMLWMNLGWYEEKLHHRSKWLIVI